MLAVRLFQLSALKVQCAFLSAECTMLCSLAGTRMEAHANAQRQQAERNLDALYAQLVSDQAALRV